MKITDRFIIWNLKRKTNRVNKLTQGLIERAEKLDLPPEAREELNSLKGVIFGGENKH